MTGSIYLMLGPMYAEKSSNLLRQYRRYNLFNKRCLLVKYKGDNRYNDENYIATHDRVLSSEKAIVCHHLIDLEHQIDLKNYDVICIDEIQFYPDNLEFVEAIANSGKMVVASGLSGNFKREPFKNIPELTAKADNVVYLNSVCMVCKREGAAFTKRMSDEVDEVVVGGVDKYLAVCRDCYFK